MLQVKVMPDGTMGCSGKKAGGHPHQDASDLKGSLDRSCHLTVSQPLLMATAELALTRHPMELGIGLRVAPSCSPGGNGHRIGGCPGAWRL